MDKLFSYEAWKQAQSDARAKGLKLSNCFLLPADLRRKIDAGLLSMLWTENGLFLLEDCGSFYRCYYYLSPTERPGSLRVDRETVIEFPFTGEPNSNQLLQIEKLHELGFVKDRESGMMSCTPDKLIRHPLPDALQICSASEGEIAEILNLLDRTFDARFAFLPTKEELLSAVAEDRVLVAMRDGRIVAALHAGFEKTVAAIRHVAVVEDCRGCGLGKSIVEAYHRRFAERATAFQHWVDLHNTPALSMYQSFGYAFSLRKANEYILTPNH